MKEYLKLFGIRIVIYILLFICVVIFFDTALFRCSACYIENSVCLGGYGGLDIISVLAGYIIPVAIFELNYLVINKKTNIKATKLTIIMSIIFISINLGIFKFIDYFGGFYSDGDCTYCAMAFCNNDYTNCSFIDEDGIKRENLNCSYYVN